MENKAAQMDKVYNPQAIEGELYKEWEETGAFVAHRVEGKQPFTIVMPPPNITRWPGARSVWMCSKYLTFFFMLALDQMK